MLTYLSEVWGVDLVSLFPAFQVPTVQGYVWCLAAVTGTAVLWRLLTRSPSANRGGRRALRTPASPPADTVRSTPAPVQG
jgi:hypothetical protein